MSPAAAELSENKRRMAAGELYYCFTPELNAERDRCKVAMRAFNASAGAPGSSRREAVRLWREYVMSLNYTLRMLWLQPFHYTGTQV